MSPALPAALLLALAPPGAPAPAGAPPEGLAIPYARYRLGNGLEVILSEDHRLPLVAVDVWYHVGAYDEPPGRTGFAHLFEHMMFEGSRDVGKGEHIRILEQIGASEINGTTELDRTNYFETVPGNQLETALWLESDRMGFLLDTLTPQKLDNQREVVMNERRETIEAAPYGLAGERLWQALFPRPHPYHGMVIGSMKDLAAASLADVEAFFREWYAPADATLCIVGDFEAADAAALVEKYFGTLPTRPRPAPPRVAPAVLDREIVLREEEKVAVLPKLLVGWHSPRVFGPGDEAADVLALVLAEGKSSLLQRRLVHELQIAQSVHAEQQSLGAQSVFTVEAVARPGVATDRLLVEVDRVLERVRAGEVGGAEVRRARNRLETALLGGLQRIGGFGGKADQLQRYNHYLGDPGWLPEDVARYRRVTPEAVARFARETLRSDRRVVVHAIPAAREGR